MLPADAPRPKKSQGKWEGSNRQYRGRVLRALGALPHGEGLSLAALGAQVREGYTDADEVWLQALVQALVGDGLVQLTADAGKAIVRLP